MDKTLRTVMFRVFFVVLTLGIFVPQTTNAQEITVAHQWNEVLLDAIRNDFARPTVHARNLWHTSVAMYDVWAVYDEEAQPFFLGKTVGDYECLFDGVPATDDIQAAREEAISYAMYNLILYRFQNAPGVAEIFQEVNAKMNELGYDPDITSVDYIDGTPAHLGNYIAQEIIAFGLTDGSNEINGFTNQYYAPVNEPLDMGASGNPDMIDPNRWQPLVVEGAIDQAGNPIEAIVDFLSPEWGDVVPFSLNEDDLTTHVRDGDTYQVWKDPGAPPFLEQGLGEGLESNWKWGYVMVALWQSHHDINDPTIIDISPASLGNNPSIPDDFDDYNLFYDFFEGGDQSQGYSVNPATNEPYTPQLVKRADYARVLAEFWADGPDSETPPGHWFTILNKVNAHPLLDKRWNGQGPIIDDLEWDVKSYFTLGSTMHDAAICAWSIKGYYDYLRPVSAIRYMAEKGQCSDVGLPNYHPDGWPLIEGYVELVEENDPLVGDNNENLNEIKIYTWRGPDYITFDDDGVGLDEAGVGWILAKDWWPYQRPTFVSPPFAGYVSGHSVFSRAAAEVLTLITGSPYFPGGMSDFVAEQNEFLVFEEGPSTDIILQWATYQDASDQTSLSRIWGGIHPPADDIPGRLIGLELGPEVYDLAVTYFTSNAPRVENVQASIDVVNEGDAGSTLQINITYDTNMDMMSTPEISWPFDDPTMSSLSLASAEWANATTYSLQYLITDADVELFSIFMQVVGAVDTDGFSQAPHVEDFAFAIDTRNPSVDFTDDFSLISDSEVAESTIAITVTYDESMDTSVEPTVNFPMEDPSNTLAVNADASAWLDNVSYQVVFDLTDNNEEVADVDIELLDAFDAAGNIQNIYLDVDLFSIDTHNPSVMMVTPDATVINDAVAAGGTFAIDVAFDEVMSMMANAELVFPNDDPLANSLTLDEMNSMWMDDMTYHFEFTVIDANEDLSMINLEAATATDMAGNEVVVEMVMTPFAIDTENPSLQNADINDNLLADINVGAESVDLTLEFSEAMDMMSMPMIEFSEDISASVTFASGSWVDDMTYTALYDLSDEGVEIDNVGITISGTLDANGNEQMMMSMDDVLAIDTRNPEPIVLSANDYELIFADAGDENFSLLIIFDEAMDTDVDPFILFPDEDPSTTLTANDDASGWLNSTSYQQVYNVSNETVLLLDIDIVVTGAIDAAGNLLVQTDYDDFFDIDINPVGVNENENFGVSIYPNPVTSGDVLTIRMDNPDVVESLDIHGANGELVRQIPMLAGSVQQQIAVQTNEMAAGNYTIAIQTAEGVSILRFNILR
ncbi:DUF6851 domain-containing protein [Sanyastnella coralliicola]|uniref:DUF6851 domain-containing protein n=1 Tax=Sanyastnella coralliicola TaxID=3069118 RepID=UPI0027BB14F4|nr:T9SS type A sorting domain-containing protein [Longitalea sp. SCSIO 12813]